MHITLPSVLRKLADETDMFFSEPTSDVDYCFFYTGVQPIIVGVFKSFEIDGVVNLFPCFINWYNFINEWFLWRYSCIKKVIDQMVWLWNLKN